MTHQTPEPAFKRAQREFVAHLRDPANHPKPVHLDEERVAIYRYAVYHNIEKFMSDNYPRVKEVMTDDAWHAMVRDYLIRNSSATPTFAQLPGEFLNYLSTLREDQNDPAFLRELAHFDWLENHLATDERTISNDRLADAGSLAHDRIEINPIHLVVSYRFPVQIINAQYMPDEPPPQSTHIVAFRNTAHEYCVIDLNAVSRRLFETVRDQPERTATEILTEMALEMNAPNADAVLNGGLEILARMQARGLILGTMPR